MISQLILISGSLTDAELADLGEPPKLFTAAQGDANRVEATAHMAGAAPSLAADRHTAHRLGRDKARWQLADPDSAASSVGPCQRTRYVRLSTPGPARSSRTDSITSRPASITSERTRASVTKLSRIGARPRRL